MIVGDVPALLDRIEQEHAKFIAESRAWIGTTVNRLFAELDELRTFKAQHTAQLDGLGTNNALMRDALAEIAVIGERCTHRGFDGQAADRMFSIALKALGGKL